MAEHASMPNVSVVRDFMEETTVRHVSHKVTIAFTAGCSQLFWQKLKRAKIVFLRKKIKKMLYSRRGRVSQATIFCLWASCITLLKTKVFKSSTLQISETKHFRFSVILF